MRNEDWQKHRNVTECHICNKSLVKDLYCDSMAVYDPDSEKYCGQAHRKCYHQAVRNRYVPYERRSQKTELTYGSRTIKRHACSAQIHCLYQTSKIQ